ncbi:hypothetical protein GCM10020220_038840 [Nonomuraea rubra]
MSSWRAALSRWSSQNVTAVMAATPMGARIRLGSISWAILVCAAITTSVSAAAATANARAFSSRRHRKSSGTAHQLNDGASTTSPSQSAATQPSHTSRPRRPSRLHVTMPARYARARTAQTTSDVTVCATRPCRDTSLHAEAASSR